MVPYNAIIIDDNPALMAFADKLEKASIQTIEDGVMTKDLYSLSTLDNKKAVNSEAFLDEIKARLDVLVG